jgi:hypothetical protein
MSQPTVAIAGFEPYVGADIDVEGMRALEAL